MQTAHKIDQTDKRMYSVLNYSARGVRVRVDPRTC